MGLPQLIQPSTSHSPSPISSRPRPHHLPRKPDNNNNYSTATPARPSSVSHHSLASEVIISNSQPSLIHSEAEENPHQRSRSLVLALNPAATGLPSLQQRRPQVAPKTSHSDTCLPLWRRRCASFSCATATTTLKNPHLGSRISSSPRDSSVSGSLTERSSGSQSQSQSASPLTHSLNNSRKTSSDAQHLSSSFINRSGPQPDTLPETNLSQSLATSLTETRSRYGRSDPDQPSIISDDSACSADDLQGNTNKNDNYQDQPDALLTKRKSTNHLFDHSKPTDTPLLDPQSHHNTSPSNQRANPPHPLTDTENLTCSFGVGLSLRISNHRPPHSGDHLKNCSSDGEGGGGEEEEEEGSDSVPSSPLSTSSSLSSVDSLSIQSTTHHSIMSHHTFGLPPSRDNSTPRAQQKPSESSDYPRLNHLPHPHHHQLTPRSSPRGSNHRPSTAPTISSIESPSQISPKSQRARLAPPALPPISLVLSDSNSRSQLFRALVNYSQPQALNLLILLLDLITIVRGHTSQTDWDIFDRPAPSGYPYSLSPSSKSSNPGTPPPRAPKASFGSPSPRRHLACVRPGTSDGLSPYPVSYIVARESPSHKRTKSGLSSSPLQPSLPVTEARQPPRAAAPSQNNRNPWINHLRLLYCRVGSDINKSKRNVLNLPPGSRTLKALGAALDRAQDPLAPSMGFSQLKEVGKVGCEELSTFEHVQAWWNEKSTTLWGAIAHNQFACQSFNGLISLWPSVHFPTPSLSQLYQISQKHLGSSEQGPSGSCSADSESLGSSQSSHHRQTENSSGQLSRVVVCDYIRLYLLEPSNSDLSGVYKLYPNILQSATPSPSPPPMHPQSHQVSHQVRTTSEDSQSSSLGKPHLNSSASSLPTSGTSQHPFPRLNSSSPSLIPSSPNLEYSLNHHQNASQQQRASCRRSQKLRQFFGKEVDSCSPQPYLNSRSLTSSSSGLSLLREDSLPVSPVDRSNNLSRYVTKTSPIEGLGNRRKSCTSETEDLGPPRKRSSTATIDTYLASLVSGRTGLGSIDGEVEEEKMEVMNEDIEPIKKGSTDFAFTSSSAQKDEEDKAEALRALKRQTKLQKLLGEPITSNLAGYAGLGVTVLTEVVVERDEHQTPERKKHPKKSSDGNPESSSTDFHKFHGRKHFSEIAGNQNGFGVYTGDDFNRFEGASKSSSKKHLTAQFDSLDNSDQLFRSASSARLGAGRKKLGDKIQKFLGDVSHIHHQSSHGNGQPKMGSTSSSEKLKGSEAKKRSSKFKITTSCGNREGSNHNGNKDLCSRTSSSDSIEGSQDSMVNEGFSGRSGFGHTSNTTYSRRSTRKLEKLFGEQIPNSNLILNSSSSTENLSKKSYKGLTEENYRNSLEILSEYCMNGYSEKAVRATTVFGMADGGEGDELIEKQQHQQEQHKGKGAVEEEDSGGSYERGEKVLEIVDDEEGEIEEGEEEDEELEELEDQNDGDEDEFESTIKAIEMVIEKDQRLGFNEKSTILEACEKLRSVRR